MAVFLEEKNPNLDTISQIPTMPRPKKVLMVGPDHFTVIKAINVHMAQEDGSPNLVDKDEAIKQWENLKKIYEDIGIEVHVLKGAQDLPDMVFCANQGLPGVDQAGSTQYFLSHMKEDYRHKEVPHLAEFFEGVGAQILNKDSHEGPKFEGMGDALWVSGRRLLLGGYGFRTDKVIYKKIQEAFDCEVATFELKNPKFYHLDTCLSILNETTVLACMEAYTDEGKDLLKKLFPNIIEVSSEEADSPGFACNAHCPDERNVIIQKGCPETVKALEGKGFKVWETETSEFIKSGGSVFCMKVMFF